ncbi:MAG: TPR end-of-group domain-containing protein [Thermoanaerobaculia bacterium]
MRKIAVPAGCVLLIVLAAVSAAEPPTPAAEAYAKGQEHLGRRSADDLRAAVQDFERATAAEATFAPAWAGLAEARALLFDYRGAREAALRGLALDEHLAAAHAALGFARLHGDWDWAGAETELRRAVELDPQRATPRLWYAIVLEVTGRSEDAVREARKAAELQPKDAPVRAGLGYRLYWARRYDEAVTELTAALALDPKLETAQYFIGRARVQQGRYPEARAAFTRARELSPRDFNLRSAEAYLDAVSGHRKQAETALSELERLAIRELPFASQAAGLHAVLGHKDSALEWLERAQFHHEGAVIWVQVDPRFDSLREEPRFKDLLRRMGLGASRSDG